MPIIEDFKLDIWCVYYEHQEMIDFLGVKYDCIQGTL